jgi:hypothetical protein
VCVHGYAGGGSAAPPCCLTGAVYSLGGVHLVHLVRLLWPPRVAGGVSLGGVPKPKCCIPKRVGKNATFRLKKRETEKTREFLMIQRG